MLISELFNPLKTWSHGIVTHTQEIDCVRRAYSRPILGPIATIKPNLKPWILKIIFSLEMVKTGICFRVQADEIPFFRRCVPKNAPMPPIHGIAPGVFDYFVGSSLKGLTYILMYTFMYFCMSCYV